MVRITSWIHCMLLLASLSFASEPNRPLPATCSTASTPPPQEDVAAIAEPEFPPRIIRPETIRELRKGAKPVGQVGGPGVHDGKAVGIIANTYEVDLPGFEGKQPVQVQYIQGKGTIIGFKGPGFLYRAEGGQLVRKKLVRLSSQDKGILEEGIRHAIRSQKLGRKRSLLLVLCKEDASFPPSKACLARLSTSDVTFTRYQDWDPRKSKLDGEATAEIVQIAPDRVEFRWRQVNFDQEVQHVWGCEFRLHNGDWIRRTSQKQ